MNPRMKRIPLMGMLCAVLLPFGAAAQSNQLSYKVLNHNGAVNANTAAPVVVAPSQESRAITIRRIRVSTNASATTPSYVFVSKAALLREGETENVSSCSLPTCFQVLAAEAVKKDNRSSQYPS